MEREQQSFDLEYWTLDQAAAHFGITRRSVRRYIQAGLPVYFAGTLVKPAEYVAAHHARRNRQRDTQKPLKA